MYVTPTPQWRARGTTAVGGPFLSRPTAKNDLHAPRPSELERLLRYKRRKQGGLQTIHNRSGRPPATSNTTQPSASFALLARGASHKDQNLSELYCNQASLFPEPWKAPACSFFDLDHFPVGALRPTGALPGAAPAPPLLAAAAAAVALASAAAAAAAVTQEI